MNFLNPLVLIGLAAASIPLILHLLNLRKMKTVEFSSLMFLKELQKSKIRNFKIKQIILLILRTLIIISIVFAFSRPTIPSSLPFFQSYSKTSAVILVDNSFSMDVSDANGSRLKQAKNAALKVLSSFKEGDEVLLSDLSALHSPAELSFSKNIDFIKDKLNKITPITSPANLNSSLKLVGDASANAINLNKSLFIITDAQENIFTIKNKDTANILSTYNNCYFIVIGSENYQDINNMSIDSLGLITSIFNYKKIVELEAFVKNFSNSEIKDAVASLIYDSIRVAQRSVSVPANDIRPISVGAQINKYGATSAMLELESDALSWDNRRYFGFNVPQQARILIAGSSNDIGFISKALAAVSENNDFAKIDLYPNQKIAALPIEQYDIAIISNSVINDNDANSLRKYVEQGGTCLLFPSQDYQSTNKALQSLGFSQADSREFAQNDAKKFTSIDKNHPLFEGVFKLNNSESDIESPSIIKIMPPKGGVSIINTSVGSFLSESRIGDGRILYIAVAPEQTWGNLQFTGIFPTLVYRSVIYLTSSNELSQYATAGDNIIVNLPKKFSSDSYKVIDPNGNESFVSPIKLSSSLVLNLNRLDKLGVYTIYDAKNNFVKQIAVNFQSNESNLKPISNDNIDKFLMKSLGKNTSRMIINNPDKIDTEITRASLGTELWQIFVILAILFALTEMIVQKTSKNEANIAD